MAEQSLKSKTLKGLVWNSINTLGNMGMNFIVGIILARMLMPSDYGALAMVGVFTSVIALFTDGGLTTAIIRKEDRTEEDKCTIFYYNIVACYICYGIIYLIAPFIADFYNMPILCKLARVTSLGMLISPFASMQGVHFTINLDFKTPAYIGIVCNFFSSSIAIWMAYNGYGVWALAVPGVFTSILRTIITIIIVRWKPTKSFSYKSFKELFGFSSKLLGTRLVECVYVNIAPLVIGKFYSPALLGLYEKGKGWPTLPASTFNSVLQSVTFPVLSKMQDDIERLRHNYRKMLRLSAFIIFPIMICLASVARPLTIVIITERWLESVPYMQIICLYMMWLPIQSINQNLLTVTGNSQYLLKNEIIRRCICVVLMCSTLPFGVIYYCCGNVLMALISLYINSYYSKKIIDYGFFDQMKEYVPILFNCFIMAAISLFSQSLFENELVKLIMGVCTGAFYYILSAKFLSKSDFDEILVLLCSKIPFLKK